jgi:hypothetical protein
VVRGRRSHSPAIFVPLACSTVFNPASVKSLRNLNLLFARPQVLAAARVSVTSRGSCRSPRRPVGSAPVSPG